MEPISNDFSFYSKIGIENKTIINLVNALNRFNSMKEMAEKLSDDFDIFLDTNVLLDCYRIPLSTKLRILDFLNKNKDRIYITHQVEKEFLKHRENEINSYYIKVTNNFRESYEKFSNSLDAFKNDSKNYLEDYPEIKKKVTNLAKVIEGIGGHINSEVKKRKEVDEKIKYDDEVLNLYVNLKKTDQLQPEELKIIKDDFNNFKIKFDEIINSQPPDKKNGKDAVDKVKKMYKPFPGMGDLRDKPDNPYGDYILFHEMLKHVKNQKKDIIFLTNDSTKEDWFDQGKPYLHYIENIYLNTERCIYILNAKNVFMNILNVEIKDYESATLELSFEDEEIIGNFLVQWSKIENLLRDSIGSQLNEKYRAPTMLKYLEYLRGQGILDIQQLEELDFYRKIRNEVVHGLYNIYFSLDEEGRNQIIEKIQSLYEFLRQKFKNW